ncbi:DUF475 domain-containing protein [Candidatus Saccharibacteria bacterium]|nr:DUF475 domain-containing protein [Candidatus Saccharibacteria bacterium]
MKNLLKIYWFAAVATIAIWILVGWQLGLTALFTVFVLTMLEVTFSADNAIINSRIVTTLSPIWQKLFLTLGIFTAVFVVRFVLPIVMIMLTSGFSFGEVITLINNSSPLDYSVHLHGAELLINAFGGTFLILVALNYFMDHHKEIHWFKRIERRLAQLGQFENLMVLIMLIIVTITFFTVDPMYHTAVSIAMIFAIILHIGLQLLGTITKYRQKKETVATKYKTGLVALSAFIYLEILDASFSLDSVIGAFAMTNDIWLIMAGLGAGALWVRGMTIHLVRHSTLTRFKFLEHGAHWAIAFLGGVMLAKLYGVELSEWLVGSVGLILISLAIWWSVRR